MPGERFATAADKRLRVLHLAAAAPALGAARVAAARGRRDAARFIEALPRDPYTDASLRYRSDADGYSVYSVGPNLRDDGGAVEPPTPTRTAAGGMHVRCPPTWASSSHSAYASERQA